MSLIKEIASLSGNVLCIGCSEEILNYVSNNDDIHKDEIVYTKKKLKGKKVSISKLKFKKLDYIICDYSIILKHLNNFVYNSIKKCNYKIYFYNFDDSIIYKYERYGVNIANNNDYVCINVSNVKINIFKKIYFNFIDIIDVLGDILMN